MERKLVSFSPPSRSSQVSRMAQARGPGWVGGAGDCILSWGLLPGFCLGAGTLLLVRECPLTSLSQAVESTLCGVHVVCKHAHTHVHTYLLGHTLMEVTEQGQGPGKSRGERPVTPQRWRVGPQQGGGPGCVSNNQWLETAAQTGVVLELNLEGWREKERPAVGNSMGMWKGPRDYGLLSDGLVHQPNDGTQRNLNVDPQLIYWGERGPSHSSGSWQAGGHHSGCCNLDWDSL